MALYFIGGPVALLWGFFVSTTLLWHGTFSINSFAHWWGRRRYETSDDSKNSFLLSFVTMGEGWHNNHHYYPRSVRQGFFWWEIDITYYILKALSAVGLVWDLHTPPQAVRDGKIEQGRKVSTTNLAPAKVRSIELPQAEVTAEAAAE